MIFATLRNFFKIAKATAYCRRFCLAEKEIQKKGVILFFLILPPPQLLPPEQRK